MSTLNRIFMGVNPGPSRNAIADYIKKHGENWDTYVQPFAGRFGLCEVIARVTEKPENIYASDISLFSDLIGFYLSDQPLEPLGLRINTGKLKHLEDYLNGGAEHVAVGLYLIKYAQFSSQSIYYFKAARTELERHWDKYIGNLTASLQEMKPILDGIKYRHLDYRLELKQHRDNPRAFIVCDPPRMKGDYQKMFDPKTIFDWDEPQMDWYDPNEFSELMETQLDSKATTMLLQFDTKNVQEGWNVVAALDKRSGYSESNWYLLSNKKFDPKITAPFHKEVKPKFRIFSTDEVTRKTRVHALQVDSLTAQYYRSLLVHKLGTAGGEAHYLILLDGKVACVVGVLYNQFTRGGNDYLFLNYTIKAKNENEPKLSRLLFGILYSEAFKQEIIGQSPGLWNTLQFRDFTKMRSVTIHAHEDLRHEYRGTRMIKKEKVKGSKKNPKMGIGLWKIGYEHDIERKTYKQIIAEYVQYKEKQNRARVL